MEVRMRNWADKNAAAARALDQIDRRRRGYIEKLLRQTGVTPSAAATRAQLLYWAYLGAALSRTRLSAARLDRTVAELTAIGLG